MSSIHALITDELPHLQRYALTLVNDHEEAADLVQESLERALKCSHQWDPATALRPWLFRIQHNLYVSWVRRRHRECAYANSLAAVSTIANSDTAFLELATLEAALERLTPAQYDTMLLFALDGLSYEETAAALGVRVGTVRSRIARGRAILRQAFDKRPPDSCQPISNGRAAQSVSSRPARLASKNASRPRTPRSG